MNKVYLAMVSHGKYPEDVIELIGVYDDKDIAEEMAKEYEEENNYYSSYVKTKEVFTEKERDPEYV